MQASEEVPEGDLVLSHEVVHSHFPLPHRRSTRHKELRGQEQVKHLLPPGLPSHLEATQRGQQLGAVCVALLMLNTGEREYTVEPVTLGTMLSDC